MEKVQKTKDNVLCPFKKKTITKATVISGQTITETEEYFTACSPNCNAYRESTNSKTPLCKLMDIPKRTSVNSNKNKNFNKARY